MNKEGMLVSSSLDFVTTIVPLSHWVSVTFLYILRWGRYLYDRRTEKILQCNEKVGIQETPKTHSKTTGKTDWILQKKNALQKCNLIHWKVQMFIYCIWIIYTVFTLILRQCSKVNSIIKSGTEILWVKYLLSSLHKYCWILHSPWNWLNLRMGRDF